MPQKKRSPKRAKLGSKRPKILLKDLTPPVAYLHAKKAQETNPEFNKGVNLENVTAGANKELTFQCTEHPNCAEHRRDARPNRYSGCLVCRHPNKKKVGSAKIELCECFKRELKENGEIKEPEIVLLKNARPDIWKELHLTLNSEVELEKINFSSSFEYTWNCTTHDKFSVDGCQHEPYQATVLDRVKGTNCPVCRKRQGLNVKSLSVEDCCKCPITKEEGVNLLRFTNPQAWDELMAAKNVNIAEDPDFVLKANYLTPATEKEFWWKCLTHQTCDEHIRKTSVVYKASFGIGCLMCLASKNLPTWSGDEPVRCSCEKNWKLKKMAWR